MNCPVLSADDYFMNNGKYEYDYGKIGEAHDSCHKRGRHDVWRSVKSKGLSTQDVNVSHHETNPVCQFKSNLLMNGLCHTRCGTHEVCSVPVSYV